jgi:hypothetical protein
MRNTKDGTVALFKRGRSKARTEDDLGPVEADDMTAEAEVDEDTAAPSMDSERTGPLDREDVTDDSEHLNLGSIWLKGVSGMEVRLEVNEQEQQITGVTSVLGDSAVQLQAFAAPRHEGIWAEVSEEIASGISQQGGTADSSDGPFGRELLGRVPAQLPDGKVGFQPMRFVGVDGPRWLLRAVFHGRAAIEAAAAQPLESLVRRVVVVRGAEPMGPRELLALQLPEGATRVDEDAAADPEPTSDQDLNPFERGPEITEIH